MRERENRHRKCVTYISAGISQNNARSFVGKKDFHVKTLDTIILAQETYFFINIPKIKLKPSKHDYPNQCITEIFPTLEINVLLFCSKQGIYLLDIGYSSQLTPDYPLQSKIKTEKDRIKEVLTRYVHALRDECELVPATLAHLSGGEQNTEKLNSRSKHLGAETAAFWRSANYLDAPKETAAAAKSLQLCPTLCNPTDGSPPSSSVPGILQARILEWVAISFSNACMHAKSLQSCPTLCEPMDSSPPGSSVHRILWQEYWSGLPFP